MAESSVSSSAGGPTPIPGLPEDWDQKIVSRLVDGVDQVRIKSSGPAIGVARAAVFGILGLFLVIIATIMFLIGLVRALNILVTEYLVDDGVWLVYMIVGALFSLIGLLLWSKRPRGAAS